MMRLGIIAGAVALSALSCSIDELGVPGTKESSQDARGKTSQLENQLNRQGFYLASSQMDASSIPAELKDKVAIFQISVQSDGQPVMNARIEAFEPGTCETLDMPVTTEVAPASVGAPEIAVGAPVVYALSGTQQGDSSCVDRKLESFGPNEDSNFFSLVLAKSKVLALNIFADGYENKIITLDGSKAKLIVLNINLGTAVIDCVFPEVSTVSGDGTMAYMAAPSSCGGASGSGGSGIAVGAPGVARACEEMYAPVCGQPAFECPDGKAPCPQIMRAPQTYESTCSMDNAGATLIHDGPCTKQENPL